MARDPRRLTIPAHPWSVHITVNRDGSVSFNAGDSNRMWHMTTIDAGQASQLVQWISEAPDDAA